MLTLEQLKKISEGELSKLTPKNRELVLQIISEYEQTGKSSTWEELYKVDYNEIPVSIDEFIENPYYLGKSTRNGESIYPFWRTKYREIFNPSLAYEEIVFTGAIGVGKTKTADVCLAYLLYKLMCLKNPQKYFKMNEGEEISIFFLNINLALAEGVGFNTLHKMLIDSPWFMERGTVTGRIKERYNPPNNITIKFGSKSDHALGQQCYCALMDEADFTRGGIKGSSALDIKNGIMQTYNAIKERMNSRFIKNGVQYGRLFLVSSKKSDQDFIEAYIEKMKSEGQDKHMLVIDEPQWIIKPEGTFSKEKFPVAVGNRSLRSMILPEDCPKETLDAYEKQGYQILWVPVSLKQSFVLDVNTALMNLAGISVVGATSFFNYDMFSKCYVDSYKNPFTSDVITTGIHDDLKISDFFQIDKVPYEVRKMPQFIHIDGSLTGDRTGISSVGVSGMKETMQYLGSEEVTTSEMMLKHIFTIGIKAPQGSEISFEKTRQFIYYLKAAGFNIIAVSLDGFQSADMKQMLLAQGYDASIISLDRSPEGYLSLRSAMNDGRIALIQIELLETELIKLQRDVTTGKLDHPKDGCFTGDTKIRLVDGRSLSILELIQEQDYKKNYVYTVNEKTYKIEPKPIKKVFQTKITKELLEITLDSGAVIKCTPEHKFMLRDGSYCEAQYLKEDTALMPLYTKVSTKGLKGYRLYYEPSEGRWHYEHRKFCNNIISNKGVVHHCNYNKLDNTPDNLIKITASMHSTIHNNNTMDYDKVSKGVREWHKNSVGTDYYELRRERCRESSIRFYSRGDPNYITKKQRYIMEQEKKHKEIEEMFGVVWENLTMVEKDSYGVKYSRIKDPSIEESIINHVKENHRLGKYKKAYEALHGRKWYTNGTDNIYIKDYEEPPEGYIPGRTCIGFKKGQKKFSELPPEEAKRRRDLCRTTSGRKWVTNGNDNIYLKKGETIPDGYHVGRTMKPKEYKNHRVLSIKKIIEPCRVYDLEIEDNHNFALDCGIFVHNSKDLSDSLAGATLNALNHKQSLIDMNMLWNVTFNVNEDVDPQSQFMEDMQRSLMGSKSKGSTVVKSGDLDNLFSNLMSDSDILVW